MDQQQEQKKSGSILNDLQGASSNLRIGRFLVSYGGRIATSAVSAIGGLVGGVPLLAIIIGLIAFILIFTGGLLIGGQTDSEVTPSPQPSQPPISQVPPPGEETPPPSPPPPRDTVRACTQPYAGTGYCSIDALKNYFGNNEGRAIVASLVCQAESLSFPFALNDNCSTNDYSVGLFQINLVAHCGGAYAGQSCKNLLSLPNRNACEQRWKNPVENIKYAELLSGGGSVWTPWGTWLYAGSMPPVQNTVTKCGVKY